MSHSITRSQLVIDALVTIKFLVVFIFIGLLQSVALAATQVHPVFGFLFLVPLLALILLAHRVAETVRGYIDSRAIAAVSDLLAAAEARSGGLDVETGAPVRGRRALDELEDVKAAEVTV